MTTNRHAFLVSAVSAAALIVLGLAGFASAQDAVAPTESVTPTGGSAATAPASEPTDEEFRDMIQSLTPEQLEELIARAMKARLKVERDGVAREIGDNMMYMDEGKDAALTALRDSPADTQQDNIDRICKAFARVDRHFARPYKLFTEGKYAEASAAFKDIVDLQQSTFLSAAKVYMQALSLEKTGKNYDAVDAYGELMASMPDRISFASAASLNSAQLYEKMGRMLYAMQMYSFCLKNYGLTLEAKQREDIRARLEELIDLYQDPMKSVSSKMGSVGKRLDKVDSGKETQKEQKEIVMLLEDMIKTIEEQQQSGSSSSSGKQQQGKKSEGQQPGEQQPGDPQGTQGNPTKGAERSVVVPGPVARPTNQKAIHPSNSPDWSAMPPREREKLEQAMKAAVPDMYRDIISDYRTRLAQEKK
jgi:tetratricopeptide (TPR) repeat protein